MLLILICCLVVIASAITLFAWGRKSNHNGRTVAGFVLAIVLVLGLTLAMFTPTKYEVMRVVHVNSTTNVITLIDSDGKAYYVDTDEIANVGEFLVDSQAYVVKGGLLGDVKFVTPKQ